MAKRTTTKVPSKIKTNTATAGGSTVAIPVRSVGRPTVITQEVIRKLEEVFAIDGSVEEACFYADIGKTAFFEWQKRNPEYAERFEALRQKPVLKARETVIKDLVNPSGAQWYLTRKKKAEFGAMVDDFAGMKQGGPNIYNFFFSPEVQSEVKAMEDKIKEALTQPRHVVNP